MLIKLDKIKELIELSDLTVASVERKAGIKRNSLQSVLYGRSKSPKINLLQSVASVLDCDIEEIAELPFKLKKIDLPWAKELFIKIVEEVDIILTKNNVATDYSFVADIILESYKYSVKNNYKVDIQFINWYVKKNI
jgi:transcriptional regulator with XRE-family HTH domain